MRYLAREARLLLEDDGSREKEDIIKIQRVLRVTVYHKRPPPAGACGLLTSACWMLILVPVKPEVALPTSFLDHVHNLRQHTLKFSDLIVQRFKSRIHVQFAQGAGGLQLVLHRRMIQGYPLQSEWMED